MGYDREKLHKEAKERIVENKLFFIEDIVAYLPCDKTTFYRLFPPSSNEYNTLKDLLDQNRVELKVSMRSKWYKSTAPALQLALMKLICTTDERKKLAMTYNETEIKPVGNVSISFMDFEGKNKESQENKDDAV